MTIFFELLLLIFTEAFGLLVASVITVFKNFCVSFYVSFYVSYFLGTVIEIGASI